MKRLRYLVVAYLLFVGSAFAADAPTPAPASPRAAVTVKEAGGSTIIGEQDSAMGLTLTPWKEEFATGLDQPPSLYRAPTSAINSSNLQRQTEYRDNLTSYRRTHSQYTQ